MLSPIPVRVYFVVKALVLTGQEFAYAAIPLQLLFFALNLTSSLLSVERKRASQNLTRLSKLGMPKGAGKKGEKPPRKRKCAEPVHTFTPMKVSTSDTSSDFHSQSVNPPLLQTSSVEGSSNSVASSVVNYGWPPPYYDYYNPMSQNSYSCFGRGTWPHPSSSRPQRPPQRQDESNPCTLKFVSGNICICQSCRGSLRSDKGTPCSPTHDLCVARLEKRQYWNSTSSEWCVPSKETNSHYWARVACVQFAYPSLVPDSLVVPDNVSVKLNSVHKNYLSKEFGLSL